MLDDTQPARFYFVVGVCKSLEKALHIEFFSKFFKIACLLGVYVLQKHEVVAFGVFVGKPFFNVSHRGIISPAVNLKEFQKQIKFRAVDTSQINLSAVNFL